MSYLEQHPHPGPLPPHPGEQPKNSGGEWSAWYSQATEYNKHVMRMRKHNVARAVDSLSKKLKEQDDTLTPADNIAFTLGMMFLDESLAVTDPSNVFAKLFGGLL